MKPTSPLCNLPIACFQPPSPSLPPSPHWPLTESKISKFLTCSRLTTCPLEPIPTTVLQTIGPTITPVISHMINSFLSTRHLSIRIQSGWGDITAQEIPSQSDSNGKLSPGLISPITVQDHWENSFEADHGDTVTEPPPWPEPIWFQEWPFHRNSPVVFVMETPKTVQSSCSVFGSHFAWHQSHLMQLTSAFSFHLFWNGHHLHLTYLGVHSGCHGNVSFQLLGC